VGRKGAEKNVHDEYIVKIDHNYHGINGANRMG
jgi:hypothetical protein